MVTTESMRHFAADCVAWARASGNPSQRQIILDTARSWTRAAEAIERYADDGRGRALPDLREKLD